MKTRIPAPPAAILACLALTAAIAGPRPASAQAPEKFTNLKVLPKNISRDQLLGTMRGFSGALGVRCDFCHAEGDTTRTRGLDFASDARAEKRIARVMMKMAREINRKLIPKTGIQSPATVPASRVTTGSRVPRPSRTIWSGRSRRTGSRRPSSATASFEKSTTAPARTTSGPRRSTPSRSGWPTSGRTRTARWLSPA